MYFFGRDVGLLESSGYKDCQGNPGHDSRDGNQDYDHAPWVFIHRGKIFRFVCGQLFLLAHFEHLLRGDFYNLESIIVKNDEKVNG